MLAREAATASKIRFQIGTNGFEKGPPESGSGKYNYTAASHECVIADPQRHMVGAIAGTIGPVATSAIQGNRTVEMFPSASAKRNKPLMLHEEVPRRRKQLEIRQSQSQHNATCHQGNSR